MSLQVLLSIMNEENPQKYLKEMNIKGNYVIINQITDNKIKKTNMDEGLKKIISICDRGLSKSRNLAIKNSTANIGLISDDDLYYVDDYEKIIGKAYEKYPEAAIIAFVVEYEDKKNNKKVYKGGRVKFIRTLKISSVQLTLNLEKIKKENIYFDENFGSGSSYFMGEENIFLYDCLKKRMKIYYVPQKIGTLRMNNNSKWFKGYNEEYLKVKGAMFYRMSKILYPILIFQFALRKREKFKENNINVIQRITFMFNGVRAYKKVNNI